MTLRLVPTNGSYDNVARLRDPMSGIEAAFVQSATTTESESPGLLSLGTMFYEPLYEVEWARPIHVDYRRLLA